MREMEIEQSKNHFSEKLRSIRREKLGQEINVFERERISVFLSVRNCSFERENKPKISYLIDSIL